MKLDKNIISLYHIKFIYVDKDKYNHTFDIGFTSTITKAEEVIYDYSNVIGFRDHSEGIFYIYEKKIVSVHKFIKKIYLFWLETEEDKNEAYCIIEKGPFEYYSEAKKIKDKYKKIKKYKDCDMYINYCIVDKSFQFVEGFIPWDDWDN